MKKVVCFGLCFLIVLCSFVLSFADSSLQPILVPQGSSSDTSSALISPDGYYTWSNIVPAYVVYYKTEGSDRLSMLFFSDASGTTFYSRPVNGSTTSPISLSRQYHGYYFFLNNLSSSGFPQSFLDSLPVMPSGYSAQDVIDSVDSSLFSVTFDLTYLVDGSISWLSTFAQAVKNSGLLLFMVLFGFVGVGIGLFRRFYNG